MNGGFLMEAPLPPFSPVQWIKVLGRGKKHRFISIILTFAFLRVLRVQIPKD